MGLYGRLHFAPRIYCLTLPMSVRHKQMQARLGACGMPYEFVYGVDHPKMSDIPPGLLSDTEWIHRKGNTTNAESYLRGAAGCKLGVMLQVDKALADGDPGCILCQDDCVLTLDFKTRVLHLIHKLPEDVAMLGLCYVAHPDWDAPYDTFFNVRTTRPRLEWMYYAKRSCLLKYKEAMLTEHGESDVCWERYVAKHPELKILVAKDMPARYAPEALNSLIGYSR